MDEKTIARFWSKVDKNGPVPRHMPELGPCWVWCAAKDKHGYGRINIGKRPNGTSITVLSHRLSYTIAHGPVPRRSGHHGTCVCHKCDNPSCVNPDHMFLGTMSDNMRDKVEKGRHARGTTSGPKKHPGKYPRREKHYSAKLSTEAVAKIRRLYRGRWSCGPTMDEFAKEFGVSRSTVADALKGSCWGGSEARKVDERVKLSGEDLAQIRGLYKGRGAGPTQTELATRYGVTQATISWAVRRRS